LKAKKKRPKGVSAGPKKAAKKKKRPKGVSAGPKKKKAAKKKRPKGVSAGPKKKKAAKKKKVTKKKKAAKKKKVTKKKKAAKKKKVTKKKKASSGGAPKLTKAQAAQYAKDRRRLKAWIKAFPVVLGLGEGSEKLRTLEPLREEWAHVVERVYFSWPRARILDIAPLQALPRLDDLGFLSSAFKNNEAQQLAVIDNLALLTTLRCLNVGGLRHVTSIAPLAGLESLKVLTLILLKQLSDLSPLSALRELRYLQLVLLPSVRHLKALQGLPRLEFLELRLESLSDLSPLTTLPALKALRVSNSPVSDLRSLAGVKGLESLTLSSLPVRDLRPLADCRSLRHVSFQYLEGLDESSVAALLELPELVAVEFNNQTEAELEPELVARLGALLESRGSSRLRYMKEYRDDEYIVDSILERTRYQDL
jgi:hypothetical protein